MIEERAHHAPGGAFRNPWPDSEPPGLRDIFRVVFEYWRRRRGSTPRRFRGWLLFDIEHRSQAKNTAPTNPKDWRATVWEIHPITSFKIDSP